MAEPRATAETDRPLRADARRNRARVLATADEVFAAEGLAVPIDEIARRAGVGIGTVYRHFPTKEALFEAVMVERLAWLAAEARRQAAAGDPVAGMFEFMTVMVERSATNRGLHDALLGAGVDVRAPLADVVPELMDAMADLLARAQATGRVRGDITAYELKALTTGLYAMRGPGVDIDRLRSVIYDGLRT